MANAMNDLKPELTAAERRALDGYYQARDEYEAAEGRIEKVLALYRKVTVAMRGDGDLEIAVRKAINSGDDDLMMLATGALLREIRMHDENERTSASPLSDMEIFTSWPSFKRAMEKIERGAEYERK